MMVMVHTGYFRSDSKSSTSFVCILTLVYPFTFPYVACIHSFFPLFATPYCFKDSVLLERLRMFLILHFGILIELESHLKGSRDPVCPF